LNGNCRCMQCCHWNTLHRICTNKIGNDNIHQSSKIVSSDDKIHSSLCKIGGKSEKPLVVCELHSLMQITTTFRSVSWVVMHSFPHRQCSTWIPKSSMVWLH
jgi:hypothetical protein